MAKGKVIQETFYNRIKMMINTQKNDVPNQQNKNTNDKKSNANVPFQTLTTPKEEIKISSC